MTTTPTITAERLAQISGNPKAVDELTYLVKLGLWAQEHAVPALLRIKSRCNLTTKANGSCLMWSTEALKALPAAEPTPYKSKSEMKRVEALKAAEQKGGDE